MNKILISPSKYIQGAGAINEIGRHVKDLGSNALVLGGKTGMSSIQQALADSFAKSNLRFITETFGGQCSRQEIDRVISLVKSNHIDVMVGAGGGKALDTAKAVAHFTEIPVAVIPTIAATDAPCSAVAILYTNQGSFESCLMLRQNPSLVLVDTAIIVQAPVRLFISGMGDALATWFEADACAKANANNLPGGQSTSAALCLARLCYDLLIEYGYQAKMAVANKVVTPAVEKIVEANILLSGIGFESSGLAAAHAIHNGLTVLEETHHAYHGEKVAFGTLAQMVMENRSRAELEEVFKFCKEVGLPVTLADIGVTEATHGKIRKIAEAACAPGETVFNEPFIVSPDVVYAAIRSADALGREL